MNNGGKGRRRDSSLYKDVAGRQPDTSATAESDGKAVPGGRFSFVLESTDPEVVPVEHQAVIGELQAKLAAILQDRDMLEGQLATHNKANKLQIAQIKGRLADMKRRQAEIEGLLSAREAQTDDKPT